jgi:plastocyanin
MDKTLIWILVGAAIVIGIIIIVNLASPSENGAPQATQTPQGQQSQEAAGPLKEFTVTASNYKFSLTEMRVNKGDRVRVTLVNEEGNHDWRLDEFSATTPVLRTGGQSTVEFIADKAGTFEYYCSVDSHRAMGMKGSFIVQ